VPDPLQWVLGLCERGKLPAMLRHAGYPTIAAGLDDDLIAAALLQVEAKIQAMMPANRA
jgi:hypothetical protein